MNIHLLLLLLIGVGLGYFVQSIVGFASALVALPILLTALDIKEAVALMSLFSFFFSIILVYRNWKFINKKIVMQMSMGILIGVVCGVLILRFGNPLFLKKALGVFILLFICYSLIKKTKVFAFKKLGHLFGFAGGLFNGLFATGGAPMVIYIYNKLNNKNTMRATILGALGVANFMMLPTLAISGVLTKNVFTMALWASPMFLLAIILGQKTYSKIDKPTFEKALMVVLLISGIFLMVK